MNIDDFKLGMDKMLGDRHINLSAEKIGLSNMPMQAYIGTWTKFLLMRSSILSLQQKEMLTIVLSNWWINGEQNCLLWLERYVASLNETKKLVRDYQKTYGCINIPKEYKDRPKVEKLAYKAAYINAYGVLAKSNLFTQQGILKAADSLITLDLLNNKTADNYGK